MVRAVLELDGISITTTDEVCVRTLWKLMGTALRPDDVRQLEGATSPTDTRREPAR